MPIERVEYEHRLLKKENAILKDRVLELLTEYDEKAEEKAEVVKEYTEDLKKLAEELFDTRTSLRTGVQPRTAVCDRIVDYDNDKVSLVDVITGDIRLTRTIHEDEMQIPMAIADQAEYVKIISIEDLPKKCADMLGKFYKVESRQKEGKVRACYFKDENGQQRKIPLAHVELYNWAEVEELHPSETTDEQADAPEVENA